MLSFVNLHGARYSWVWDHWLYLPSLGLPALAAAGVTAGWRRAAPHRTWLGRGLVAALAVSLGALTWSHCAMFHDNETLFRTTIARNPGGWMAHTNLGLLRAQQPGRLNDAIAEYKTALRLYPNDAATHVNLGLALAQTRGWLEDAMVHFKAKLRLRPDYASAWYNLGVCQFQSGDLPLAEKTFREALRLSPHDPSAQEALTEVLQQTGRR